MSAVRGRLAPLAVRPFGRLLFSYTLNELGDSVGIVALAVLVYDRTEAVAPTRMRLRGRVDESTYRGALRATLTAAHLLGLAVGAHLRDLRALKDPLADLQARLREAELRAKLAWEILEIQNARFARLPENRRPHFTPAQRFRLTDLETYVDGKKRLWSGIFRSGQEGHELVTDLEWEAFVKKTEAQRGKGQVVVDLETYAEGKKRLFAAVFRETTDEDWLKKSELAVQFLDRYGNEVGARGIKHNDSIPLDEFPDHLIKAVLATEEQALGRRLARAVATDLEEIDRLKQALADDERVVALRSEIERQARAQLDEGAITAADYVETRTDVLEARLTLEQHRVALAQARASYVTTLGLDARRASETR